MRERGYVASFCPSPRGFGFLTREGCANVFFHITEAQPGAESMIQRGMLAEYTVTSDERGRLRAVNVELLEAPVAAGNGRGQ